MGNTFSTRLKKLMEREGLSAYDLASRLELTPAAVYNYLAGKSTPKVDLVGKLLKIFPKLNADWVLTGRGEMYDYAGPEGGNISRSEADLDYDAKQQIAALEEKLAGARKEIEHLEAQLKQQEELLVLYRELRDR